MSNNESNKRLLRLTDIVGDPHANPPVPALVPVGKSTWWAGVKAGRYPKPIKLSPRVTVWRAEDVFSYIAGLDDSGDGDA